MDAPSLSALIDAIRRRFGDGDEAEQADAAQQGAEQIAGVLPSAVMPMDALDAQRRKMAMLDQLGRGN